MAIALDGNSSEVSDKICLWVRILGYETCDQKVDIVSRGNPRSQVTSGVNRGEFCDARRGEVMTG